MLLGGFVPYATRINFSPGFTTASSTGLAKKFCGTPRHPCVTNHGLPHPYRRADFAVQLVLGKPRPLLAIAFYLSLYGLKAQRSVRMFSAKHLEAHRPQGTSRTNTLESSPLRRILFGYLYGDLPELGRTVMSVSTIKRTVDSTIMPLPSPRSNQSAAFPLVSFGQLWTTLGFAPYAYFKARGDEKNRKRMLWGMTRYYIYFGAVLFTTGELESCSC